MAPGLVRVRLVRVRHPDTRSATRRYIYATLEGNAVETPFGYIVLNQGAWRRLEQLNERARQEVGRDVVIHMDIYLPVDVLERILEEKLSEAIAKGRRSLAEHIKAVLEKIRGGGEVVLA